MYEQLERDHAPAPRQVHDLRHVWAKAHEIPTVGQALIDRITAFCTMKHFTLPDLLALETRVVLRGDGPDPWLCWPGYGRISGERVVTAVKYRCLNSGKRQAAQGSTYGEAMVIGDPTSMDWFVAEGETEGARLFGLVGKYAAILVLPAGALTVREAWMNRIPRGATIYAALDADEAGDNGSRRIMRLVGSRCVRVRPPQVKDWCEWDGDVLQFVNLVKEAKQNVSSRIKSFEELIEQYREERSGERPPIRLGWGTIDSDLRGISDGQVLGVAARTAVGKTWCLASVAHHLGTAGVGGLIGSLEMPGIEWAERQLAIYSDVPPEEVEKWAKGHSDLPVEGFKQKMRTVVVCDQPMHLDQLPTVISEARVKLGATPLRAMLIDYLGLLHAKGKDVYERTSGIAKGLKEIAKDEKVAIVVAMQLSRQGGNGSQEVSLEMLRDSGVLEEAVDFLLGMWRPGLDNGRSAFEQEELRNVVRCQILKNRKGPAGRRVDLLFRDRSMLVYEPTNLVAA